MNGVQWSSLQYEKLFLRLQLTHTQYNLATELVYIKIQLFLISQFTSKSNKHKISNPLFIYHSNFPALAHLLVITDELNLLWFWKLPNLYSHYIKLTEKQYRMDK